MKIIAGAIMASISLLAEMINEWAHHFFYAVFNIAKGALAGSSGYTISPPYTTPEQVQIFIVTRIIIWIFIVFGIVLIIWGLREKKQNKQ